MCVTTFVLDVDFKYTHTSTLTLREREKTALAHLAASQTIWCSMSASIEQIFRQVDEFEDGYSIGLIKILLYYVTINVYLKVRVDMDRY